MAWARIEIETPRWLRLVRDRKVIAEARQRVTDGAWEVTAADGYRPVWSAHSDRRGAVTQLLEIAETPAPAKEAA